MPRRWALSAACSAPINYSVGPIRHLPAALAAARGREVPEAVGKPEAKARAKPPALNPGQLLKNLFH